MRSGEEREVSAGAVFLRKYGLLLLWLLVVWGLWDAWGRDPFVPRPIGLPSYHHNGPRDLPWHLGLSAAALVVIYVALRPWSERRSWWRPIGALVALLVLVPWTLVLAVVGMHMGPIVGLDTLWVLLLDLVALSTLLISLAGRYIEWRSERERAV